MDRVKIPSGLAALPDVVHCRQGNPSDPIPMICFLVCVNPALILEGRAFLLCSSFEKCADSLVSLRIIYLFIVHLTTLSVTQIFGVE
jgi:hypothetical protein